MLLRFVVSNFLSFAEEVEFNMFPGNFKIHKDHVYHTPEVDLLKTAAIYGANGSGKSNFVKAIKFLHDVVKHGRANKVEIKPPYSFKLDDSYQNKPTSFEIEISVNNRYFAYGISLHNQIIMEEWLHEISPKTGKESVIFERKSNEAEQKFNIEIKMNDKYKPNEKEQLRFEIYAEELEPSMTFLTRAKDRISELKMVYDWFQNTLEIITPNHAFNFASKSFDEKIETYINTVLPQFGTGISRIESKKLSLDDFGIQQGRTIRNHVDDLLKNGEGVQFEYNGKTYFACKEDDGIWVAQVLSLNSGKNQKPVIFDLNEQSDGTRRMFDLIPALHLVHDGEAVFIVDEIERSLHPTLIKEFLDLFLSKPTKGQLIFTTHESYLLDLELFRQDEIWFTEKNKEGATSMYSLSEFKPRYDLDIRKGYLAGRFGAIPFLGNLKELNWHHATEEQGV